MVVLRFSLFFFESLVQLNVAQLYKACTWGSQCPPLRLLSSQDVWLTEEQLMGQEERCLWRCLYKPADPRKRYFVGWRLDYSCDWMTGLQTHWLIDRLVDWLSDTVVDWRAGCLTVGSLMVFRAWWLVFPVDTFNCRLNLSNYIQDKWWTRSHLQLQSVSTLGSPLSSPFLLPSYFLNLNLL